MTDPDIDAVRRDIELTRNRRATTLDHLNAVDRVLGEHAPALLVELGRRDARISVLEQQLAAALLTECPVYGCGGQAVELHAFGEADPVAVRLDCGHGTPKPASGPVSLQDALAHPDTREAPLPPA